ncbi:MAG: HI0074 family nucleotidyltransferase substrate-binding subunit [Lachnospiraceae bacterium]|nr:HI0074 family nucleotidyltransferase substrate-binding subunit [Lachnospiraceae bacterium]
MKKFDNFKSNLRILEKAQDEDITNEFIKSGIIDKFYIQFELAWKTMKEYLKYEGIVEAKTGSPRDIIKAAYKFYEFMNEDNWISMLNERNDTAHIYDGDAADRLVEKILNSYIDEFKKMEIYIEERYFTEKIN